MELLTKKQALLPLRQELPVLETDPGQGLTQEQADGTIRVSLGLDNTMEDMDAAADQMIKMFALLSKYKRR